MLAAMPQAPSQYHPVRAKDRVTERRNYVLREMWQNGYLDEATYRAEIARAAARCRTATSRPSAMRCRRATISPTRSAASCRPASASVNSLAAACDPRHGGPDLQKAAASALREALEKYDRARGVWRGTGQVIAADLLASEAGGARRWRTCNCRATSRAGSPPWCWKRASAPPASASKAVARKSAEPHVHSRPRT
jgi:penicillin-binding protein 1A